MTIFRRSSPLPCGWNQKACPGCFCRQAKWIKIGKAALFSFVIDSCLEWLKGRNGLGGKTNFWREVLPERTFLHWHDQDWRIWTRCQFKASSIGRACNVSRSLPLTTHAAGMSILRLSRSETGITQQKAEARSWILPPDIYPALPNFELFPVILTQSHCCSTSVQLPCLAVVTIIQYPYQVDRQ